MVRSPSWDAPLVADLRLSPLQPAVDPFEEFTLPCLNPGEPLEDDPLVDRHHERDQGVEWHLDSQLVARRGEGLGQDGAPLPVDSRDPLAKVRAGPSRAGARSAAP